MMKSCKTKSPALSASRINPSQSSDHYSPLHEDPALASRNCILPQDVACTKRFFRQRALIYLKATNRLVFVIGTDGVLCDVGTEVIPTRNTHELHTSVGGKLISTSSMGTFCIRFARRTNQNGLTESEHCSGPLEN